MSKLILPPNAEALKNSEVNFVKTLLKKKIQHLRK